MLKYKSTIKLIYLNKTYEYPTSITEIHITNIV